MPGEVVPRITRTSSLFTPWSGGTASQFLNPPAPPQPHPQSTPGLAAGERLLPIGRRTGAQPAVPNGYEIARYVPGGVVIRPKPTSATFYTEFLNQQLGKQDSAYNPTLPAGTALSVNGVMLENGQATNDQKTQIAQNSQASSVFGPLNLSNILPDTPFLFDRRAPMDPGTGMEDQRQSDVLQHRQANSTDPSVPANENMMTISAGVYWLRNLAARDKAAYNKLVVLLRNAGYGNLPANDAELPLNGYSQTVGAAFAYAANDLAQANQGGDSRTLMEYLTDRGKSYADYLAQQAADARLKAQYQPVDRRYQDPATLNLAAKSAAMAALGRKLTPEEEAKFDAAYRAKENTFYDQVDAAGRAKTNFSGYQPDATGQADAFLEGDQFQNERAGNLIGQYAQSFIKMMGG